jgi:RNA polymerase sigma-70 factor, ECF subfamily
MNNRSSTGGSSDGSTALLEAQIPDLRRFARALVRGDRDRADDLVQDVLERALSHWHQRRRDGSLRNWLYTILYNRFLTERQRSLTRNFWLRSVTPIAEEDLAIDAGESAALAYRDLLRGFAALPADQRAALFLVGFEDLSYAEAAAVLNIPIGTVMSRLSRGRECLRHYMEGDEDRIRSPRQSAKRKPCLRAVRELVPT